MFDTAFSGKVLRYANLSIAPLSANEINSLPSWQFLSSYFLPEAIASLISFLYFVRTDYIFRLHWG